MIIGVVGGIGSGKSSVAEELVRACGCKSIDADHLTHEVLVRPEIMEQIKSRFAPKGFVYSGDPKTDRRSIGRIVFSDKHELEWLQRLTLGPVDNLFRQKIIEYKTSYADHSLIIDAPLLFECRWDGYCDQIWFVEVSDDERKRRYLTREPNATEHDWVARERNQLSLATKRKWAAVVIDNNGPWESTLWTISKLGLELL